MNDKLEINSDRFLTERAKMTYVFSRLEGHSASHCYARREPKSKNPFQNAQDILDHLALIYADPNRIDTFNREFEALKQGTGVNLRIGY